MFKKKCGEEGDSKYKVIIFLIWNNKNYALSTEVNQ